MQYTCGRRRVCAMAAARTAWAQRTKQQPGLEAAVAMARCSKLGTVAPLAVTVRASSTRRSGATGHCHVIYCAATLVLAIHLTPVTKARVASVAVASALTALSTACPSLYNKG